MRDRRLGADGVPGGQRFHTTPPQPPHQRQRVVVLVRVLHEGHAHLGRVSEREGHH